MSLPNPISQTHQQLREGVKAEAWLQGAPPYQAGPPRYKHLKSLFVLLKSSFCLSSVPSLPLRPLQDSGSKRLETTIPTALHHIFRILSPSLMGLHIINTFLIIEVPVIYHKTNAFKVYNSVVLRIFTKLYYHHHLIPEYSLHPKKKPWTH